MRRDRATLRERYINVINSMMRLPNAMRSDSPASPIEVRLRAELTELAHQVAAKQLTWGTTGRLSARLGLNQILISPPDKSVQSLQNSDFMLRDLRQPNAPAALDLNWTWHQALYAAQKGEMDPAANPLKGFAGTGVLEIVTDYRGNP